MIVSADVIETGIAELWDLLQEHGAELEQRFRNTRQKSADDGSIGSKIVQQAELAGFIGKTALAAGSGVTSIYIRTLRNAAVAFFKGPN